MYTGGNKVVHNGYAWRARWWTQGDEPSTANQWGVWERLGQCSGDPENGGDDGGTTPTNYTITATASANGTISPSGSVTVAQGDSRTFTVAANSGYEISDVTVNGSSVGAVESYTFTNVNGNGSISATFSPIPSDDDGDTGDTGDCASPSWNRSSAYTGGQEVAHNGYIWRARWWTQGDEPGTTGQWGVWERLGQCSGDPGNGGDDGGTTPTTYTITATASSNGTISPSGSVSVNAGANQTFTFNPANGYEVSSVIVNGNDIGAVSTYTFNNVGSNGTISVNFRAVPSTGTGLASILSESMFNEMFPNRNPFYTYADLISAAASYPEFANTGDLTTRKREVAAFLANIAHETGNLVYVEEIYRGEYCQSSHIAPCAPGKRYYGRGPIQLSWNYNYHAAGVALGLPLLEDPDLVARDPKVAWQTSLWFWVTQPGAGARPCHVSMVTGLGFGETVRSINGSLECNGANPSLVQRRVDYYVRFCSMLGVDPGPNTHC
ncbi:chitinase, GH19 family [Chitinispirillum alkaliphilum]|nr:chitinase, GH19 family [Chitinispirillum alkaliphilum]